MSLEKWVRSEIHRKILRFFWENPQSVDTPRGIATWTGEEIGKIRRALEDLTADRVLIANRGATTTGYSFTQDRILIDRIETLLRKGEKSPSDTPS